jgi:enterochelin esterase-like enzyme
MNYLNSWLITKLSFSPGISPTISMKKVNLALVPWLVATIITLLVPAPARAATFNDAGFATNWNRVDKPVQDVAGLNRGYTWGPAVAGTGSITTEPYNGTTRKVQYFDKARMEVNDPGGNPQDLFYVTTGLLVKELVTGNRQDGTDSFTALAPSQVQVAGDNNAGGANAISPVYASFKNIGTFAGTANPAAPGAVINSRIDRAGEVSAFTPPEQRLNSGYDPVTGHNIADVFEHFANQGGLVWNGSAFVQGQLFFGNPLYVLGRPLVEPYWTKAVVAGQERDVLVQLFERRVLTYTPANPAAYRVEMGNVGQHYYRWRYALNACAAGNSPITPAAPASTPVEFGGKGTVRDGTFFSPALGRSMPYRVYLPPGYDSGSQAYPVLYMLHGYSGNYLEWHNLGLLGRAADLMGENKLRPFIIVLPLGETGYWINQAHCGPRWADYLANDVVGHIDATYRTLVAPANRAIGGLSMGAHGSLQIGFNFPGKFGIIGAHSPTLRTRQQTPDYFGDTAYFATVDPISLARIKNLAGYKIWLDIGQQDVLWMAKAQELHQILLDRNVAHSWNIFPGDHGGDYWASHLIDYLQFYNTSFAF